MVVLNISLVGGPPWGFRVRQNDGEPPTISQVVFDGRAFKEGLRPNDIIEAIDEQECTNIDQVHARMRNAQGVMRLRLKRQDPESDSGTQISELSDADASDKTPTVERRRFPLEDLSPNFSKPPLPTMYSSPINDENSPHYGYSGGSRGSAQDKKKYFEQLAMRQMPQTDRILERKILMGTKHPPLPSDQSSITGYQSSLSGYDSVGADFAGFSTLESSDRQTPVSSIDPLEDNWIYPSPHPCAATNYDTRGSWLPPLPEETFDERDPTNIYESTTNQSLFSPTPSEMVQNLSMTPKPTPPPTPPKPKPPGDLSWRIRSTGRDGSLIASPANHISPNVEVPRPQSVAQLREQITNKLEMKTPSGSRPMSPAVIHPPVQPQRVCITPQPFGRGPTSVSGRDSDSRMSVSCFSETPFSITSSLNTSAATSPLVDNYRYHYDEIDLPNKYDTLPRNFSIGTNTNTLDTGYASAPSTLKRQHSQVFSSPEVQHAVLLNPNDGKASNGTLYEKPFYGNSIHASNDTLKDSKEFVLSETGAPFSVKPPPIPVDGSIYMLGETDIHEAQPLSNPREVESPTLALDYGSPLDNSMAVDLGPPHPPSHLSVKSLTVPPPPSHTIHNMSTSPPSTLSVDSYPANVSRTPDLVASLRQHEQYQPRNSTPQRSGSTYDSVDIPPTSQAQFGFESNLYDDDPLAASSSLVDQAIKSLNDMNGTLGRRRYDSDSLDDRSTWYKSMYKSMHQLDNEPDQSVLKYKSNDSAFSQSSMNSTSQRPTGFRNEPPSQTDSLQRRSKSVGNHVEPKSLADKWREEEKSSAKIGRPRTAMDALFDQCTSPSTPSSCCSHRYAVQATNETKHFHLPSYRFVHEDARPIPSSRKCLRCGRQRRDYTWQEIEHLYAMLDKKTVEKELKKDELSEKIKQKHIHSRLEDTTNELQKLIDHLEAFSTTRSKSTPEFAVRMTPSQRYAYLTRMKPSTSRANQGAFQNGNTLLSQGINELKKLSMDEMLQRQRAERLSEELEEQNNRRHHYVPNASPALQNNFARFDHLLHNDFEHRSSRSSTPKRSTTGPTIQTATVLYKFIAQSNRELSLNRGDVVRIHRELDSNWYEGERNGQVGIFPTSYVQLDEDPSTSRQNRVRAMYPFQARNKNELNLKKGEILKKRREIDANWYEGTNSKGQIGIFPKNYVQDYYEGCEDESSSVIPDRPKTPKISSSASRVESPTPTKKIDRRPQVQAWEQRHSSLGLTGPANIVPKNSET